MGGKKSVSVHLEAEIIKQNKEKKNPCGESLCLTLNNVFLEKRGTNECWGSSEELPQHSNKHFSAETPQSNLKDTNGGLLPFAKNSG